MPKIEFTATHLIVDRTAATQKLIEADAEGQIGIYHRHAGDAFHGYVIRYAGQSPYFEEPEE